jgi:4-methylaminobutanoate oxidase (formaldehyde-forming)
VAASFGIEVHLLGPNEAQALYPVMDPRLIEGALFVVKDGQLNPVDTVNAFMAGARKKGARLLTRTDVIDAKRLAGGNYHLATTAGAVTCENLVLACGLWTDRLTRRLRVPLPLHPCEHFYVVTEPLDFAKPSLPVLRDTDGYVYLKEDAGKILIGAFEPDARALPFERLPANPEFVEVREDWDHFALPYGKAAEIVPALEEARIGKFMNGPESFTPDSLFLLGELPGLPPCYVSAGYNSEGFEMAPGAAAALAQWIIEGEPATDLSDVNPSRFHPFQANRRYLAGRAAESLASIYQMHWRNRQRRSSRPARKSALHDRLAAKGARFGETLGWERPLWYAPGQSSAGDLYSYGRPGWYDFTQEECRAVRQNVAIFDQSSFGKHLLQGRHACAALQRLCANDIDVPPGRLVYTHMLNSRGGIEVDVTVNRLSETSFLIVSSAAFQCRDRAWVERHIDPGLDAALVDVTSAHGVLSIQGPNARRLLSTLTPADLSAAAFPFATSQVIDLGYGRVTANRLTFVGELGFELYVPSEFLIDIYDLIVEAGREFGLVHAGYHALEHLRCERGYREFALDLTPDDTPFEAGLGFAVKLDKPGGFIGRDRLVRDRESGVPPKKRLVMFRVREPSVDLHRDEPIWLDGRLAGYIRSGAYGFTLDRAVGMGYVTHPNGVDRRLIEGGRFEIEIAGERHPAAASLQAFYDPRGEHARI